MDRAAVIKNNEQHQKMQRGIEKKGWFSFNLKSQFTAILLLVISVMTITAAGGIYSLSRENAKLEEALDIANKVAASIDTARTAQVLFKKQVQEWKDVLLRGNDPELFNKHHDKFVKNESAVQENLNKLVLMMKELDISPTLANESIKRHAELGVKYREALRSFDSAKTESAHIVDKMVKGIDHPTTDGIDETVAFIWEAGQKKLRKMRQDSDDLYELQKKLTVAITLVAIIVIAAIMITILRRVLLRLNEVGENIAEISKGDFTVMVPVTSNDEIGALGDSVNQMVAELREMFTDIRLNSKTLASSAEELSAISTQLAGGSEEMSSQAHGVASATEQMSSNINSMASGVEQSSLNASTVSNTAEEMSANMRTIAGSIEKMTASIREVAKNSGDTAMVANKAMDMSKVATETMKELGTAANEIGKVTQMIKRIAEQTNLLALNATIEAASAGEAGKGFAVVANEIKELANQSAKAAEEIAMKIGGVQGSTVSAVKVITDVSGIIGQINESVNVITNAVNEQTLAANEITKNVQEVTSGAHNIASSIAEVAKGASDISRNAGEAAKGANEVSLNINGITKAVADNNTGIQQINVSSGELARIAGSLQAMVSRFKVESGGHQKREINVVSADRGSY